MEHFAGYGFNKSHSTTYALLAYQTAYLKANYPWHFMAALLTIESQNTDKLAMYLGECRDAAASRCCRRTSTAASCAFTVTPEGVRFGLGAVKNVGEGAMLALLDARRRDGAGRVAVPALRAARPAAGQPARAREPREGGRARLAGGRRSGAGGPAGRGAARRGCFAAVERRSSTARRSQRDRDQGQTQLFGGFGGRRRRGGGLDCELPDAPPWTEAQQLAGEKEALGLYWSGHPIERYLPRSCRRSARAASPT